MSNPNKGAPLAPPMPNLPPVPPTKASKASRASKAKGEADTKPVFDDGLTDVERADAEAEVAKEKAKLAAEKAKAAKEAEANKGKMTREELKAMKVPFKVRATQDGIYQGERKSEGDVFVILHGGKFGSWMEKV